MMMYLIAMNMVNLFGHSMWYLSLTLTVASLNITIFQSNCVFVLLFSFLLLHETLTFQKCFACIIAIGGVVLIMWSSSFGNDNDSTVIDGTNSILGIMLDIVGAICFAAWEVGFKYIEQKYFREHPQLQLQDTLLFQSGVGAVNLLFFWPLLMVLHYTNVERFQLPSDYDQWFSVLVLCLMDNLFMASLLCGITLCGTMLMSIGLTLVVPITYFADIIVFRKESMDIINVYSVVGAVLIIFGLIYMVIQKGHGKSLLKR